MSTTFPSINDAEKRLMTVRQQVEQIRTWNKIQENKLMQKLRIKENPGALSSLRRKLIDDSDTDGANVKPKTAGNNVTVLDDQPLISTHEDFDSLLNAKLEEQNSEFNVSNAPNVVAEKRPYLKKGTGLSRFRMKAGDFKLRNRTRFARKIQSRSKNALTRAPAQRKNDKSLQCAKEKNENAALEAFEILEQKTNDSSFCSSSSMVAQLMEDSIKSTPIKNNDNIYEKQTLASNRNQNEYNICGEYDFFGIRTLGVIDEEPSKLEDISKENSVEVGSTKNSDQYNLVIVDVCDSNHSDNHSDEEHYDSSECSSKCSCCEDNSHYLSKSVSVFTEETTTVYSPSKNESFRKVTCFTSDDAYCDSQMGYPQSNCEKEFEEDEKQDELLKSLLQLRFRELETEIDAFRSENSHLSKLRGDYEKEYNKFCEEKVQFLAKIRAEHLKGVKELEDEKKKLQREKLSFEKYMKETKNKPNKQEKEEIRLLKEEIKNLKDEMNKKESRWAAAQARIRTEMKQLKDHNTVLNEELKELKHSTKKVTFSSTTKKSKRSITNKSDKSDELKTTAEKTDDVLRIENSVNFTQNVNNDPGVTESFDLDGNHEKVYLDGRKEIWYTNGNVKKVSADGKLIKTIYYNGDVKEILTESEIVKYYYAESKIWHTQYKNGFEIMEFPNGRIEKRFEDGSSEISYPNGTVYNVDSFGEEKWTHADGTIIIKNKEKGEKKILFANGQTEIHTLEYKKREYPDGTVKIVYMDGNQETRYSNGRIRLKTKDGCLLSDSMQESSTTVDSSANTY